MKHIYEINTAVWLDRLSREHERPVTLATVPLEELTRLELLGMDAVWLMGIWERSPIAAAMDKQNDTFRREVSELIPGISDDDIIGSPYAVKSYTVEPRFGETNGLAKLRSELSTHGMKLLLDFVPNHSAFDNTWLSDHPDYYITDETATNFDRFYKVGDVTVARGSDPNLAPWPDVAQLNAFSPAYRQASIDTISTIATMCDGVRCDMAMLALTDVFGYSWGTLAGDHPADEYWQTVIASVRRQHPDFIFIAECYWDLEARLVELGFDYCYDKPVYDHLVQNDAVGADARVAQHAAIGKHLVHFLENHDEQRAAKLFSPDAEITAARYITALPGPCLWYDGQFEGNMIKPPIQLVRGPLEPTNTTMQQAYRTVLQKDN